MLYIVDEFIFSHIRTVITVENVVLFTCKTTFYPAIFQIYAWRQKISNRNLAETMFRNCFGQSIFVKNFDYTYKQMYKETVSLCSAFWKISRSLYINTMCNPNTMLARITSDCTQAWKEKELIWIESTGNGLNIISWCVSPIEWGKLVSNSG